MKGDRHFQGKSDRHFRGKSDRHFQGKSDRHFQGKSDRHFRGKSVKRCEASFGHPLTEGVQERNQAVVIIIGKGNITGGFFCAFGAVYEGNTVCGGG